MLYENATQSIATLRDALRQEGQLQAANALMGQEVHSTQGAAAAVEALSNITPGSRYSQSVLEWAKSACRQATNQIAVA